MTKSIIYQGHPPFKMRAANRFMMRTYPETTFLLDRVDNKNTLFVIDCMSSVQIAIMGVQAAAYADGYEDARDQFAPEENIHDAYGH